MSGSEFNVLLHGEAAQAASLVGDRDLDNGELRAALTNALNRIHQLERRCAALDEQIATLTVKNDYGAQEARTMKRKIKFYVILENAPDCELARETCEFEVEDDDEADTAIADKVDELATRAVDGMILSLGDTIKIVEAE